MILTENDPGSRKSHASRIVQELCGSKRNVINIYTLPFTGFVLFDIYRLNITLDGTWPELIENRTGYSLIQINDVCGWRCIGHLLAIMIYE